MPLRCLKVEDYTVGWISALPIELAAAAAMLDEEHEVLPQDPMDSNLYTFGRIGKHNIVVACLPAGQMGPHTAATVATQMQFKFTSIRFGLMVGIGGGVPSRESDIRLGDVVISQPHSQHGGVVQYDSGRTEAEGRFIRTGSLNAPPTVLLNALAKLRANQILGRIKVQEYLSLGPKFAYLGTDFDVLYKATHNHVVGPTCDGCDTEGVEIRAPRDNTDVALHFGTIASGNQVMRDGVTRDRLSKELDGILCFEMEAAGLMNKFPCLVIRGICDYADSHKNKIWQYYAAATAAACAKELINTIPSEHPNGLEPQSPPLASLRDLRFQSDRVLQMLLAEFEDTIQNDDSPSLPRSSSQFYLNFFLGCSDSHLLGFIAAGSVPVDRPDADGNFLLHSLVSQRFRGVQIIRSTLEAGADPAEIDASSTTAVHLALSLERRDVAWMLLTWWKMKKGFGDGNGSA